MEAVGYEYWPTYFRTLDALVTPGGRVAIQAITMPHSRMLASRNTHTWIQKYIFPGGLLPSTEAIMAVTGRHTALRTVDMFSLRQALRGDAAAVAGALHRAAERRCRSWASTTSSTGCGSSTWPTPRPASGPSYLDVYQWAFAPTGGRW